MLILGISALDNNCCAMLYEDNKVLAAIAEERLTRVKMQAGFPSRAIEKVLEMTGKTVADIDKVAYPFFDWKEEAKRISGTYVRNMAYNIRTDTPAASKAWHQTRFSQWAAQAVADHRKYNQELDDGLKSLGLFDKLQRVEHHLAHHACAYFCSPFYGEGEKSLVLSLDWYGGGIAGAVAIAHPNGDFERLTSFDYPHSLGLFYAQVTGALGFKMSRHEGKIVGLAAYGDPNILYDKVRGRFSISDGDFKYNSGMDDRFVKDLAKRYSREDVAAVWQKVLEDVVQEVVGYYIDRYNLDRVVMAGGVAANVKMNQRVFEIPGVNGIYVHQAMGDDGTGTGAALWVAHTHDNLTPEFKLPNVYLGPGYTDEEIEAALKRNGVKARKYKDIEKAIARRLHDGKVVARFNGRMEYGPRALGNRSILYHCKEPEVNKWLNDQLKRTEFMPFAPACLYEERETCFKNMAGAEYAAKFMTITFDGTDFFNETAPAASHVDGTARPQLVSEDINPSFYRIIKEYQKLSGLPNIINTSFNMHEEPIVCTPDDAIRAYQQGNIHFLAIGNFLASSEEDLGE
ncbi:MAG: carbamoyltransferase [Bradymonadia bacterium]